LGQKRTRDRSLDWQLEIAASTDILSTEQQALEHVRLQKPDVFRPAHHDGALEGHMPLWRATEPLF